MVFIVPLFCIKVVGVDPNGSILALPESLNAEGIHSYKVKTKFYIIEFFLIFIRSGGGYRIRFCSKGVGTPEY